MKNVVQGNHIEFDLTSKNQAVCSHCQSGFLILVCGVENGLIQKLAFCIPDEVNRPVYCPWCGKDMRKIEYPVRSHPESS